MADKEPKAWITVNGNHIPIFEGESKGDAIERFKRQKKEEALENVKKDLHEVDIEDAIATVRENIRPSALSGWFREANSDFKPEIEKAMENPKVINAGLNIAYHNYRYAFERYSEIYGKWVPHFDDEDGSRQAQKLSFKEWLNTPQTMYRGTHGQKDTESDVFKSYTPDKKMAEKFLNEGAGGKLESIQIKPIDTYGSYQTTAEQEFLVPIKALRKK